MMEPQQLANIESAVFKGGSVPFKLPFKIDVTATEAMDRDGVQLAFVDVERGRRFDAFVPRSHPQFMVRVHEIGREALDSLWAARIAPGAVT